MAKMGIFPVSKVRYWFLHNYYYRSNLMLYHTHKKRARPPRRALSNPFATMPMLIIVKNVMVLTDADQVSAGLA